MKINLQKIVLLILGTAVLTSAFPKENDAETASVEPDPEMEKYLREALENFRQQMKEGIAAINMPPLDPLDLRNLDVDVNENIATMSLRIKQIIIQELSLFEVERINANLETFYLSVKLNLPSVQADGIYYVDGKLLKIFPLYGNGSFSINLTNAEIAGEGKLIPKDETLQMDKLELNLSWNHLDVFLENFLGGGRFSRVLLRLLPKVGKNMFESFKPQIQSQVSSLLKKSLNDIFRKPEVKDIISSIIQK